MTNPPGPPQARAFDPALHRIGRAGQLLLTCTVVLFVFLGIFWKDPYQNVWQLVIAHLVTGRAGNVALGLVLEFPAWFIYLQCCLEDIIILLLFYPLLVAGYRRAVELRVLGSTLAHIRESAERNKSKIEPYGVFGLMLFVVFPFWSTGALVGAFVGYLIGMRTWVTFVSVLTGNFIAVALWVWLGNVIDKVNPYLTQGILIMVFAAVIVSALVAQVFQLKKHRATSGAGGASRMEERTADVDPPKDDGSSTQG